MPKTEKVELTLDGHAVTVSNPGKLYFPTAGITKGQLVEYYLSVAPGALRAVARRPMILKRYVQGIEGEPFYQKRVADKRPDWLETAIYTFPSGRTAEEVVVNNTAQLAYVVNLGCVDLNPHPIRKEDMAHPDELRIDLDPVPGVPWSQILDVGRVVKDVLDEWGLVGWPKTSGSRGAHIWVRIQPRWPFSTVRRAAIALAREVERRAPKIATAKWWKEERHGVFLDYNQNARDRTTASAYSVRPTPDARVSMPLSWSDFLVSNPLEFTLKTVPGMFAAQGDAHSKMDESPGVLDGLLALAEKQETAGEVTRDAPSKAKRKPTRPRASLPLITIAQAKKKVDALEGLERWKQKYPAITAQLAPEDILVDANRGRASAWYRIRINLKNVPEEERPRQETPDPDYDPRSEYPAWRGERD